MFKLFRRTHNRKGNKYSILNSHYEGDLNQIDIDESDDEIDNSEQIHTISDVKQEITDKAQGGCEKLKQYSNIENIGYVDEENMIALYINEFNYFIQNTMPNTSTIHKYYKKSKNNIYHIFKIYIDGSNKRIEKIIFNNELLYNNTNQYNIMIKLFDTMFIISPTGKSINFQEKTISADYMMSCYASYKLPKLGNPIIISNDNTMTVCYKK